jgi:YjbE family integral membrane protein
MSSAFDAHFLAHEFVALGQVIAIDLVLAGDNALVVGMAAAGLPRETRGKVIVTGIVAATILRVVFAMAATRLLAVIGMRLAGGVLLMWVCWKFWREFETDRKRREGKEACTGAFPPAVAKTTTQAIFQIVIADVSMSLDNVLAVAGAAARHTWVLVIGLTLSVALMGIAATLIASLLRRHHWISYLGLGIILWVASQMIYRGGGEVIREITLSNLCAGCSSGSS